MTIGTFAAAALLAVGPPPLLILSQPHGRAGAEVHVIGLNCGRPEHGDELLWRDEYQYANDKAHRPADPPFRRVRVTRISRTRIEAIFTVLRSDHPGRGIFTLFCAGKRNASNVFTVIRYGSLRGIVGLWSTRSTSTPSPGL